MHIESKKKKTRLNVYNKMSRDFSMGHIIPLYKNLQDGKSFIVYNIVMQNTIQLSQNHGQSRSYASLIYNITIQQVYIKLQHNSLL